MSRPTPTVSESQATSVKARKVIHCGMTTSPLAIGPGQHLLKSAVSAPGRSLGRHPLHPPGRVNVVYQPRQDWRDRKTPCPLLVVQVRPVIRDVQVNAAKRHVDPYASRRYAGTFRFEL
jgi:hypothetical protein